MSMSPENYKQLESRCIKLLKNIKEVIAVDPQDDTNQIKAKKVYIEMIALQKELEICIKNLKTADLIKKYEKYLDDIKADEYKIDMIANII